jgi:predicted cytidylate kinase
MLITISGLSGSGKSTVARILGRKLRCPAVDVGSIYRKMAEGRGMGIIEFARYAEKHPAIDREFDGRIMEMARDGKCLILQGRLTGLMTKRLGIPGFRAWIGASPRVRAGRIAGRERVSLSKSLADTSRRDRENRRRYLKTYGLDLNDLSVYDSVVQTDNLSVEQVVSALLSEIRKVWPRKRKTTSRKQSRRPARRKSRRNPPRK